MDNKKYLLVGLTLLLLASFFVLAQSALATVPPPPGVLCGNSGFQDDGVLRVKKGVYCEQDTSWEWNIIKSADQDSLSLDIGETALVNYTVTASAVATSDYSVAGEIGIINVSPNPVTIDSVSDSLGDVVCGVPFPYVLPSGWALVCNYSGSQTSQPDENVATVNYNSGSTTGATASIDWSGVVPTETDECADISDTYEGFLGTVCADGQTTFTFEYTREFMYGECGYFTEENIASFLTNDTSTTGSDNWIVDVTVICEPEGEGCTPGFWRQDQHFDSWVSYDPADDFEAVFGVDASFDPHTLLDAVWLGEGGEYALARHAVAALLNAANPDVDYDYTEAEVIAMVQAAYASGDFETTKDMFEMANEQFCELD